MNHQNYLVGLPLHEFDGPFLFGMKGLIEKFQGLTKKLV